jgi:uncharacterized protein YjbJ (UPF0337 family)
MASDRIAGAVRNSAGHLQEAVGGLAGDAKTQLRGKLNEAAGAAQNAYGKARDQADDLYDEVGGRARDVALRGRRRVQDGYDDLERLVGDAPMPAIAIAVGVGFLLGLLLGSSGTAYAVRR